VQAIGWCNNIAWNVGPLTASQYESALIRYEYNKLENYKSIVPLIQLTWNLARNIKVSDEPLYRRIKAVMLHSLIHTRRLLNMLTNLQKPVRWHGRAANEPAHYCVQCEMEVFDILFVKELDRKHVVHCVNCARRVNPTLSGFVVLEEYALDDLKSVYDNFVLHSPLPHGAGAVVTSM
jgi:histone demethylase